MIRKPDFFIVGAPKCGTTAMYNYLRQHPEIFMPNIIKEPCFFGADLQPDFHIFNPNKQLRIEAFHRYLLNPPHFFHRIISSVVPLSIRQELFATLRRLNTSYTPRPPMNPELRRRLQVEKLTELLGRDLTHWSKD